ncbi:hypothetical protein GQX73_g4911 [Xylaria multiplex]|uniref:Heterokaryon incompatibility domain-containing protein n=1 Tax=Xylaria multiplex TaxID=323545 RepID=A0A7C8IXE9_9PEZI|nr:hypothetical protein GQX73_g4911 [Xylaria multiplex]
MAIPIGSRDVFQYEELPDSGTYFRLLRVMSAVQKEPTENGPPINIDSSVAECELTVWPLEDSPPYHAVSYTWGDSAKTRWIEVNGRPIQVRWNCAYVLWQAHRRSGKDDYIWVDAICINQTDTREKSHQVAEMGKIFANAKCVLACIGPHDKFSRSFFPDLNRHSELLARASAVRNEFPDINSNNKKRFKSATKQIFRARYHSSEPWEPGELMAQFSPIISRPYFQRVWTLPELWLARRAEILCGEDCTPAELMHGLNSLMDWDMPRYRVPKWFKALPLLRRAVALFLRPPGYSPFLIPSGHVMAMAHRPGQKMEPINSISIAASLECQDLRDRVYALLSIVDWVPLEGKQIRPDYERDLFDLVLDMLQRTGGRREYTIPCSADGIRGSISA